MSICTVGQVLRKAASDMAVFKIDWSDMMDLGIGNTMPVTDRIDDASWAIAPDSPTSGVILSSPGFDSTSATSWVAVEGGSNGDVVFLDNTITTTGASVNGSSTPPQRFVRRIRIRIESC